ncbi:MAG TPA: hypothetical protein VIL34_17050 [Actinopolymorphaceae bacterium]
MQNEYGTPDHLPTGHSDEEAAVERTGHPEVDAALERLDELEGLPPSQHVDVYDSVHRRLHEVLLAAGEVQEHHEHTGEGPTSGLR